MRLCLRRGALGESFLIFSIVKEVMAIDLTSFALPQALDSTLLISSYHTHNCPWSHFHLPCHISPMLKSAEGWTR
jgi:hypothetical protein